MFDNSPIKVINHHYKGPQADFENAESAYDAWVILAVDRGVFEYGVGDETGQASFGDLVFCPPGIPLRRRAREPLSLYFLIFRENAAAPDEERSESAFHIPTGKVTLHDHARLASNFAYIRQHSLPRDSVRRQFLAHVVFDLIFICSVETQKVVKQNDPFIQQAADFIRNHFREELRLQDVAERFGFNQSQFTRRFRAAVGMNPGQYVTMLRLDRARSLLLETNGTIEAVAADCGFQSGFYLSRVFTAHLQMSPSEYRKRYRL